jgi:ribosomal protein L13
MYDPSTDCGDYVVCIGCKDVHVTGKKMQQKKYYSHTTRPGSLKEITMEKMREKWGGSELLRRAVRGMLPKNRLRDDRMARLKCKSTLELEARRNADTECFGRLRRPSTSFQGKHPEIRA